MNLNRNCSYVLKILKINKIALYVQKLYPEEALYLKIHNPYVFYRIEF